MVSVQVATWTAMDGGEGMKYMRLLPGLLADESGQDLIEYGIIAALISLAAVIVMGNIGNSLKTVFSDVNGKL